MATVKVKGMSCQHCVKSVTETMEKLGARDVKVDLLTGDVDYAEPTPIDKGDIKAAIDKIGFEYVG
ncbi:Heavy metal transport/detoxification protein [Pseudodesulfovibrio mercurii]|uniref:Heavy metal transport/detoxification protein n=1 Tax=Pseudodesulfovibrio mercurii TaxID=641491 RepID=F0JDB1_9BACT|nr:cation transporter [Pseudodesulfovibrio mercurii]EGB15785.1 Heavy metal transport/detoxification protein [Pseudodesulfovibrio mercurii]